MREGLVGVDVKYGHRVSALFHTTLGKDHGYEVHTGRLEEGDGGGGGKKAHVGGRDVANNILAIVNYCNAGETLSRHEDKGFGEGCIGAVVMLALFGGCDVIVAVTYLIAMI